MKKILNVLSIFLLFLNLFNDCHAQTELENRRKYWDYRDRLKKYFLTIGSQAGKSLPAENLNYKSHYLTSNGGNYQSDLRWGDATIHSGYYIAVLATEYKLLTDAGYLDEALKTKNELYYAIEAINRIDLNAEPYFGAPIQPQLVLV